MDDILALFLPLAEIAGIFVGFGALISVTRRSDAPPTRVALIRAAVTIGLVVIVAALLPVALARYALPERTLWLISSLVFLAISWAVLLLAARSEQNRGIVRLQAQSHPRATAFFWIALELPVQVPLVLAVLDVPAGMGGALYTTALVFNLFQAAFVLAQFVYAQETPAASGS